MKKYFIALAVFALIMNFVVYMAFDGFDWRHFVLACSGGVSFGAFLFKPAA